MKKIISMCAMLTVAATLSGCLSPTGLNPEEQKKYAKDMSDSTLKELYKYQPEAKEVIEKSSGYVVYNTYAIDYLLIATENGWGVAINNKTGDAKYLKDIAIGFGPCLGFGIMRNILVFDNEIDYNSFVANCWSLNVKADAVARFSEDGTWDIAGGANITSGARMYKIGERGLIAEAVVDLSRSWQNYSLNK